MSCRSTSDRLDNSRRAGVRSRLVANGLRQADVDRWLEVWEAAAPLVGGRRELLVWDAGASWIEGQVKAGARVGA